MLLSQLIHENAQDIYRSCRQKAGSDNTKFTQLLAKNLVSRGYKVPKWVVKMLKNLK